MLETADFKIFEVLHKSTVTSHPRDALCLSRPQELWPKCMLLAIAFREFKVEMNEQI